MKFTITEMTFGEILERGFKLLLRRLPAFFAIQLIVLSPTLVLQLALPTLGVGPFQGAFILPMLILAPIGSAAMLRIIVQEYLEQPISLSEAFLFALGRFLPLLGTGILAGLGIGLGMCACIVPGIYLAVVWAFTSQVVVMENIAGPAALSRSKSLVDGHFGRVFGIFLLLGLIFNVPGAIIAMVLPNVLPFVEVIPMQPPAMPVFRLTNYVNYAIVHLVTTLVNAAVQTYLPICATLLYFDLRNRKEAFDVSHIVAWMDQYKSWRDEPDANVPPSTSSAPPQTGIKDTGSAAPPQTGIKDADKPQ